MAMRIAFWTTLQPDNREGAVAIASEASTRTVALTVKDAVSDQASSLILPAPRVRRLIADLQEALRHLED